MDTFKIAVIGGSGGMGAWFVRLFRNRGFDVSIAGKGDRVDDAIEGCRVVIVAVPLDVTRVVIETVGPLLDETSLLMDLTSFKEAPVKWMCAATKAEVLGCHPLFGPSVDSMAGRKIVLCPARLDMWARWPRDFFIEEGAHITETTPDRHDRMMSIVQGLNHLNTMTMSATLRNTGISPDELKEFSTPLFELKNSIIDAVVGENPRLHAALVVENPHIGEILACYERVLRELIRLVESRDVDAVVEYIVP